MQKIQTVAHDLSRLNENLHLERDLKNFEKCLRGMAYR